MPTTRLRSNIDPRLVEQNELAAIQRPAKVGFDREPPRRALIQASVKNR